MRLPACAQWPTYASSLPCKSPPFLPMSMIHRGFIWTVKALTKLHGCAAYSKSPLDIYALKHIFLWHSSIVHFMCPQTFCKEQLLRTPNKAFCEYNKEQPAAAKKRAYQRNYPNEMAKKQWKILYCITESNRNCRLCNQVISGAYQFISVLLSSPSFKKEKLVNLLLSGS